MAYTVANCFHLRLRRLTARLTMNGRDVMICHSHCTLRTSGLTISNSLGDAKGALILPAKSFTSVRIREDKR
jgi:hypothetical protein